MRNLSNHIFLIFIHLNFNKLVCQEYIYKTSLNDEISVDNYKKNYDGNFFSLFNKINNH